MKNHTLYLLPNTYYLLLTTLLFTSCQPAIQERPARWEDQIVYFLMIDRFADGDPTNNDQGAGEYDPAQDGLWHGGDLAGIEENLDYLEEMGITAVWLTPPVRNQWWNPDSSFTGYHGYWASHFMETDPHYGSLQEYKALADALHARDMYLIQDVVVNHTGDYFSYGSNYDPERVEQLENYAGAPTQPPFDRNDPRDPEHREAGIYHWTPTISDFQDTIQKYQGQMADLDDLNTANPEVRKALIESFQFWIREVGVDGFRFDTPLYVEHPFWRAFLYEGAGNLAGIEPYAASRGRPDFYTFGETWVSAQPYSEEADQMAAKYLGTPDAPEMDGILNFPLQQTIQAVFAGGQPTDRLTYRLRVQEQYFPNPIQRLNFIDNHDMPRFRTQASEAATHQALFFIMSIPGVPVIYQGTEQGDLDTRPNLFGRLNTDSGSFSLVKELTAFRQKQPATRRGTLTVLADGSTLPGLFVYQLVSPEDTLIVALNTNDYPILTPDIPLAEATNREIKKAFELGGTQSAIIRNGHISELRLAAKGGLAFQLGASTIKSTNTAAPLPRPEIPQNVTSSNQSVSLPNTGADSSFLLIDGRLDTRVPLSCGDACSATITLNNLSMGVHYLQRIDFRNGSTLVSPAASFSLDLPTQPLANIDDPAGDDRGPSGSYRYPTHATFDRPNDIRRMRITRQGHNLEVTIHMNQPLSTVWNPPNGFDHIHFSLFIDVPGRSGISVLPNRNAIMPGDARWDVLIQANGWTTQVHSAKGATTTNPGTAGTVKPLITTNQAAGTVTLRIPAATLGNPTTLEGIQFYLTTWDSAGEGGLRPLAPEAASFTYGGAPEDGAKVMDDLWISQRK
jgi:glycosidase